jgi:hypothetical protein
MSLKHRRASKAVAALLLFAMAQIVAQIAFAAPTTSVTTVTPIPQQFVARLTTRNNQPITVNGLSASTGASILTGATIETGADQSATVNLGPLGTLDIAPNTKLILTYDDNGNVKAVIIFGCAILAAKKKAKGEVATEQGGTAGKTDPAAGGILDICFPPGAANPIVGQGAAAAAGASVGAPAAAGGGGLFGLGTAATIAILGGYGMEVVFPLIWFQHNSSPT